ncbi:conserved hypothetical protein (plasmid) [Rippkaea orientalis PCC 8801]|uniref:Bacterial mobilisation domain-containing protein n=1 Tax=Rippkaea orientalis (strain PCC 8801 / RF-1) TaxID=41431 RepID=B7K6N2_RIPO1|nr:plasmid mobilization relaxosome protein MobC [Rippkaea orientalis]ACK68454.1 conserved hypothetical protein [Rippkaea orientalis PCC 8801]
MPNPENKDKVVSLRFRESELKNLDEQASSVNLSRSAYITRKLQGLPVLPARVPPVNWEAYRELGGISAQLSALGNNINQIAKVLNTAKQQGQPLPPSLPSPDSLIEAISLIEQLQPTIKQIRLELSGVNSVTCE